MLTPFDWQEGIGNRAQYIESRLEQGAPVLTLSTQAGILIFTYRRQSPKIFEIYDRIGFSAIGQQSDVEAIRIAAVEFAHREGYSRSEDDVTISRVVAAVSNPLKQAFSSFNSAPFVELNPTPAEDQIYVVDYDGDYRQYSEGVILTGASEPDSEPLLSLARDVDPVTTVQAMHEIWRRTVDPDDEGRLDRYRDLTPEAMLLERNSNRENIFRAIQVEAGAATAA